MVKTQAGKYRTGIYGTKILLEEVAGSTDGIGGGWVPSQPAVHKCEFSDSFARWRHVNAAAAK